MHYKEKLKELEIEKKKRITSEDKADKLEEGLKILRETNDKISEELRECMTDNALLTNHY
jgi:hypothetical protein